MGSSQALATRAGNVTIKINDSDLFHRVHPYSFFICPQHRISQGILSLTRIRLENGVYSQTEAYQVLV
jgi:hypothetical protein